ncbi:hypothetical protein V6N13_014557 [Hibiscus sabdariffa]
MASDDGPTKTKRLYQVWKGSNDLGFLFFTSGRDPGTLPRNSTPPPPDSDEAFEETTPSMEWVNGRTPHLKLPRTKDVMVNGHTVKVNCMFVGGLTVFHFYLICSNQTTYENFRYRYDKKENPYNKGTAGNLREMFFSKIPPSLNNFRSFVEESDEHIVMGTMTPMTELCGRSN